MIEYTSRGHNDHRETDRQRQTETETDRQRETDIDRQRLTNTDRQGQIDRVTHKYKDR